ncbi:cell wall hydrolase [Halalkalibacter alkalisediminis]|uniref:Cell wall hydrolase n=1 Tax=Halalkalibacter alkalisediminis TaxID=935616 RepID=A0ABV6NIJ5_9BACI|nr:cell wall hydrolase [Halalkalibacter alkalisediminis]
MKKLFTLLLTMILVMGSYTILPAIQGNAEAEKSTQNGDIVKLLCGKYDIDKTENHLKNVCLDDEINPLLTLPENIEKALTISDKEKKLLAQLVHAEAKGEPYVGKVAVATVVLNRVEHEEFPDTIAEVIYEENAFEPVQNDSINEPADKDAYKAVTEALLDQGNEEEALFFYNPDTTTSDWIFTREVIKIIGNHAFAI